MFEPSKLKFKRNVPVPDGNWMDHFQLIRNRYLIVVVARWKDGDSGELVLHYYVRDLDLKEPFWYAGCDVDGASKTFEETDVEDNAVCVSFYAFCYQYLNSN